MKLACIIGRFPECCRWASASLHQKQKQGEKQEQVQTMHTAFPLVLRYQLQFSYLFLCKFAY